MQIHVYPDDLVYDYDGKPEKAELSDFPALADITLTPFDCVVFHWGKEQKVILSPLPEEESYEINGKIYPRRADSVLRRFGKMGLIL